MRKICRELADSGKTIFINSHILAEIELICDRVALMNSGRIIGRGTIAELTANQGEYELVVPATDGLSAWLGEHRVVFTTVNGHFHVHAEDRRSANNLIDVLRGIGVEIESLSVKKRTLEAAFIEKISDPPPLGEGDAL